MLVLILWLFQVRTRQKIRKAIKAESVVPMAFFRRAIVEASGGEVRWSKNAILALKAIVEARVHRTLALGSTLARVAKKQTLTNVGVLVVPP
jgi:histone H3/H4